MALRLKGEEEEEDDDDDDDDEEEQIHETSTRRERAKERARARRCPRVYFRNLGAAAFLGKVGGRARIGTLLRVRAGGAPVQAHAGPLPRLEC